MKCFKKFFSKRTNQPTTPKKNIKGITADEWNLIYNAIDKEYSEAASRQKEGTIKPSRYMKGLAFALELLETHMPHALGGN